MNWVLEALAAQVLAQKHSPCLGTSTFRRHCHRPLNGNPRFDLTPTEVQLTSPSPQTLPSVEVCCLSFLLPSAKNRKVISHSPPTQHLCSCLGSTPPPRKTHFSSVGPPGPLSSPATVPQASLICPCPRARHIAHMHTALHHIRCN